jgi:hypothetical protein
VSLFTPFWLSLPAITVPFCLVTMYGFEDADRVTTFDTGKKTSFASEDTE